MKRTLESIHNKILIAFQSRKSEIILSSRNQVPCLVAVSKLKPISSIIEAYECGQRHFGENYLQELLEKSNSKEIIEKCPDIRFHLIGHLQSNKVTKLPKIKNLHMIQTVDSIKLADLIQRSFEKNVKCTTNEIIGEDDPNDGSVQHDSGPIKVMIQVNTSGEDQKSGIQPDGVPALARHIKSSCDKLELAGLMTIGKHDGWGDLENQDFIRLFEIRESLAKELSITSKELDLSMGMSGDYEEAVQHGSTIVRVGTLIFGERIKN